MQGVKLVHVLTRLEKLEQEKKRLKELENLLDKEEGRFKESLLIAIEKEINELLNERIKLMELRIQEPPSWLIQNPTKPKPRRENFPLKEKEKLFFLRLYNKNLLPQVYGEEEEEKTSPEKEESPIKEEKKPSFKPKIFLKQEEVDSFLKKIQEEKKSPIIQSREKILENLPPVEY